MNTDKCSHGIPLTPEHVCKDCDNVWHEMTKTKREKELESELTALRTQVAELQAKLGEQGKQKPVAYLWPAVGNHPASIHWPAEVAHDAAIQNVAEPLYRLPPNTEAMVERARAEEREAFTKILDTPIRQYLSERELRLVFSSIENRDDFASWMIAIRATK